ncbi:hypothetical protein SFUMM280S_06214 [Streptomyces fumanus]
MTCALGVNSGRVSRGRSAGSCHSQRWIKWGSVTTGSPAQPGTCTAAVTRGIPAAVSSSRAVRRAAAGSATSPVSSASSRTAAATKSSPGSVLPPGSSQTPRTDQPSRSRPSGRVTTTPAPVSACAAGRPRSAQLRRRQRAAPQDDGEAVHGVAGHGPPARAQQVERLPVEGDAASAGRDVAGQRGDPTEGAAGAQPPRSRFSTRVRSPTKAQLSRKVIRSYAGCGRSSGVRHVEPPEPHRRGTGRRLRRARATGEWSTASTSYPAAARWRASSPSPQPTSRATPPSGAGACSASRRRSVSPSGRKPRPAA